MKLWKIDPSGDVTSLECSKEEAIRRAGTIIGATIDLTYVVWGGKRCRMAVDDEFLSKGLPRNETATQAYWQACRPGTTDPILGTAVIFDESFDR